MQRLGFIGALSLLIMTGALVLASAVREVVARQTGPEAVVARYFAALEASDLDGALAEIAPEGRAEAAPFVENNLGNAYQITGIAAEYASVTEQLAGGSGAARTVTVFLDVTQKDGARWQAGPRVPLVHSGGRVYLAQAPLSG